MSLFQSLNIGVAGLQSQSNVLNVISDNLANVNTVGYKKSSANFKTLVAGERAVATYSPGGALGTNRQINNAQGKINYTESTTHLAISGKGFFAVRQDTPTTGGILYTRAGAFEPDKNGDLVNSAGFFLQGWLLDNDGNLPAELSTNSVNAASAIASLVTVNPRSLTLAPVATTQATLRTNLKASQAALPHSSVTVQGNLNAAQVAPPTARIALFGNLNAAQAVTTAAYDPAVSATNMASGAVTPQFTRSINVLDNTAIGKTLQVSFLKTAANTWAVEIYAQNAADVTQTDGLLAYGNVTFNADGTLASISPALSAPITAGWNNVGGATAFTLGLGTIGGADGLSQTSNTSSASYSATPDYDPLSATKSMAGGGVTPHYTSSVNVLDNTGVSRALTVGYYKTNADSWAIEIYANPATDVTTPAGSVGGQVAYGTASFNADGSLASISPSLNMPISIGWNNSASANSVSFNWNPAGASTGLKQAAAVFSSALTAVKNYDPTDPTKNMTSQSVAANFDSAIPVVDPTGVEHTLKVTYLKTGTNSWAVEVYAQPATDITGATAQVASGILTFNGDGSLAAVTGTIAGPIPLAWQNGEANALTINWGTAGAPLGTAGATVFGKTDGLSQLNSNYSAAISQNGFKAGSLKEVTISEDGYVVGNYDNNKTRRLYKIPLATFVEQNELRSISGNVFAQTETSGDVTFSQPTKDSAGGISGGALEASNVETETQLVDMIVAQRAYQANAKTINTSNDMLQTLNRMLG